MKIARTRFQRPFAALSLVFGHALMSSAMAGSLPAPTPLVALSGDDKCSRCAGVLLPGRLEFFVANASASGGVGDVPLRVDSDLPEIFLSTGVLYSTSATLPEFRAKDGTPVNEAQRRQRSNGFATIDGGFEVFLYHMSNPTPEVQGAATTEPRRRRVVVMVRNMGASAVTIRPRQIIESRGKMAAADGPESRLTARMLRDDWRSVIESLTIEPGAARVIAWSPRLSTPDEAGPSGTETDAEADSSPSDFFTGMVRAAVEPVGGESARAELEVSVIAIDAATARDDFDSAALAASSRGAWSGEGGMAGLMPPPRCHVRRVVGVSRSFLWRGDEVVLNAADLRGSAGLPAEQNAGDAPAHRDPDFHRGERDPITVASEARKRAVGAVSGVAFLMAAPAVQTVSCPQARQTADMLLHPGYVHADTVGNYQVEYLLTFTLINPSAIERSVDIRFGKQDADVGLAWQVHSGESPLTREDLRTRDVNVQWAGGWRKDDLGDNTRSLLVPAKGTTADVAAPGRVVVPAGGKRTVSVRAMIVGTSSLPFFVYVVPMDQPEAK
ncbi:MAG: hypothetical protein ACK5TV_09175 [Phycisphaerales bacterium]